MSDFFESDRNLLLTITGVVLLVVFVAFSVLGYYFPNPPDLHQTVKVTSVYQYNTSLFSSRLGTVSSLVSDIKVNGTSDVYTLSCTFYQVNSTLTMTNYNSGHGGYYYDGAADHWVFDNLHVGCEIFAVTS